MSAAPLQQLEDWVGPLLSKLSAAEQRKLTRRIATDLRRSQATRIARQQNPDGSAYEARKPQKIRDRPQVGRIKSMFAKMRTPRHMRAKTTDQEAVVSITGRAARIAHVHQHGLRDQVKPGGPSIIYPRRELLGLADADREMVRDILLDHLTG